ncbi:unnamed protein product [Closterium sp. Naga37s-1]|nr:unnamed protein product [Closterium sp. Naga37s-1]
MIFNPVLACLAGGRNKAVGAKAYDLHNAALASTGLSILTPETIWDVAKPEIPLWVGRMGGLAVVKVPYANADGTWGTETDRLLLMDSRDFNRLGVGVDDLIEAYMQTILAVTAIDRLCGKLITPKGNFGLKLFGSLNPDVKLLDELYTLPLHSLPVEGTSESSCLVKRAADQATEQEDALAQELQLEVTVAAPPGKRGRVL